MEEQRKSGPGPLLTHMHSPGSLWCDLPDPRTLWGGALKCSLLQFHLSPTDLQGLLLVVLAICGGQWRKYMSFGVRRVWVQFQLSPRSNVQDFPRRLLSGRDSACQSWSHGFGPWPGKTPRVLEQLKPVPQPLRLCSRARKPQLLSPRVPATEAREPWSPCSCSAARGLGAGRSLGAATAR